MIPKRTTFFKGPSHFILPAFFFYCLFLLLPLIGTFFFSLTDWEGYSYKTLKITGFGNYFKLIKDPIYWISLRNSLILLVIVVLVQVALGLFVAILLERQLLFGDFFRGSYFVPSVVSLVITGMVFSILLDPTLGIFDGIMKFLGLEEISQVWLANPRIAFIMIIVIRIWYGFGWSMFIFVASLKGIDLQLYEAATIDGANEFKKTFYITIPLLKNAMAVALVTASMRAISVFEVPYIMTHGGPFHSTEFLATWAYAQGLSYAKVGYGASISVTLIGLAFVVGFFLIRFWNIEEAAQE
jgi:raffinose/stachyose/melibiose transport system permease protein